MTIPANRSILTPSSPLDAGGALCRVRGAAFAGIAVSAAFLVAPGARAAAPTLPTGAQNVSGVSSVSQSGSTLTVTQTSAKAVMNWQSFNVGAGKTVNFVQPSASAVSLNRVIGNDVSVIQGAINANGHVFLLNPNGVLFTSSAQVNVGGIVASTLNMKTEDFMAGRYTFEGAGSGTIVNQGNITAAKGGFVGLIAAKVTNTGSIVAPEGSVLAGAGNRVTLDLGGPIKIRVEEGVIEALIEQGGAIRADGGLVYLTAKAVGEVTRTVINHTGITEARTLSAGKDGKIYLMGGMEKNRIAVSGKLDASAPNGGNGGFIETSAANVQVADDVRVTTAAPKGKTGTWLIDPSSFLIMAGTGAKTDSSIGATTLGDALSATDVTIQTLASGGGVGTIYMFASVVRSGGDGTTQLTLSSHGDIMFNPNVGISGSEGHPLSIKLIARCQNGDSGYVYLNTSSFLRSFGGDITIGGGDAAASGAAIGRDGYSGVNLDRVAVDATKEGTSAGASGKAEFNSVIPTSTEGGNIVIRGEGNSTSSGPGLAIGIFLQQSTIVTGGAGSITLIGKGGANTYDTMNGGIVFRGSYIKAKEGNISVSGMSGSGLNQYGICATMDNVYTGSVSQVVSPFIGTNGAINLTGDSLALWAGNLVLVSGQDSSIAAPIIGIGRLFTSQYGLTKSGAGVLTLSGDASAWVAPEGTAASNKSGTFSNESSTIFAEVTRAKALNAFVLPVYLRLNTGLSSVYGNTPAFTYSLYDSSSGGTAITDALPSGTALWTGRPTATSNAATYSLTYSSGITLGKSGYQLNAGGAVLYSVNPRPVTVTPDAKSKVYGNADPELTYSITSGNLIGTDHLTGTLTRATGNNVGNRLISASGFNDEGINPNYAVTTATGLLTISQRPITITAAAKTKVYGDEDPALIYTVTSGNLVGEETLTGSLTRTPGNSVGVYATSASALLENENNHNYAITPVNSALTISQRPITITAAAKTKVYGDEDPALIYTVTSGNLVGEETLTGSLTRTPGNSVGVYATSASALLENENNHNYAITPVNSALTISARPVTVTPDAKTKVYGNAEPEFTYSITSGNLVGDDALVGSLTRTAGTSVGGYVISAQGFNGEENNSNYAVTTQTGLLSITQRPITVTPDPKSKVSGMQDPTFTNSVTSGNVVEGDSLYGSLSRVAGESPGSYLISAVGLTQSEENYNYQITAANGELTISGLPKPVESTLNSVYVVPPVVSRPASAQLNLGLQLVEVAPAAKTESRDTQASGALAFDPVAAAKRAPGTVLVLTGGVKRASDDTEDGSSKKASSKR